MSNLIPYRFSRSPIARSAFSPFADDFFRPFFMENASPLHDVRVDVKDEGDHFLLEAEMPGFDKEDINLTVEDDVLTISAETKSEKKEEKDNYVMSERRFGKFQRSFTLSGIDQDKISAACENGVLKLTLPKQVEQPKPAGKKIEIA